MPALSASWKSLIFGQATAGIGLDNVRSHQVEDSSCCDATEQTAQTRKRPRFRSCSVGARHVACIIYSLRWRSTYREEGPQDSTLGIDRCRMTPNTANMVIFVCFSASPKEVQGLGV